MSYQSDIFDAIRGNAAITGLIGERFFWDIADETTETPYMVAQTISADSDTTHDGDRTITFPLVQFSCWSPSKADAIAVMSVFRNELEGLEVPGDSAASFTYSGEVSSYDRETGFYGEIVDYRISCITN